MRLTTSVLLLLTASASARAGDYGKLPLSFEANQGQTDGRVQFLSRGRNQTLFLTSTEAVLRSKQEVFRMKLAGSNPASKAEGAEPQIARSNYFTGNDPAKWRTGIPNYGRVRFSDVYPGIDLVYYGKDGRLEYDWIVKPGADPSKIRLRFEGVQKMRVDANGDLVLETPGGEVREKKPVIRQAVKEIRGRYVVRGREVAFDVAEYDAAEALVIDPVVVYSSYLGGSARDQANAIAADGAGNAYITGQTSSSDFPTVNAEQGKLTGSSNVFVSKLSADGSQLIYSTFLGGTNTDIATGIAVDSAGNALVTGWTESTDFPVLNAYQGQYSSKILSYNSFVTKLNPAGNGLVFSTYLGGDTTDTANGIAVDATGSAYITGGTDSTDFPTTPNAIQGGPNTDSRGFVFLTKMSGSGALVYSTFLNSGDLDGIASEPQGVAADASGNAYVTGYTNQKDFILANALQSTYAGSQGIFVAKINPSGSAFVYSTYLDGSGMDQANAIAADSGGNAYVTGSTTSADFPTVKAVQAKYGGDGDAFVTMINPTGSAIVYSTYLGGSSGDLAFGIGVDATGKAWVAGTTTSTNFPTMNALPVQFEYFSPDLFVSQFSADGSALLFSSLAIDVYAYQGGSGRAGFAVDQAGNAYVTSDSGDKRPLPNSILLSPGITPDLVVLKIAGGPVAPSIAANGVVNGASFAPGIVPGSWASIQGANLSAVTDTWDNFIVNGKLPTTVDGVSVTVGGTPAYVYYVSPGQINFIVPDVGAGDQQVTVHNSAGASAAFTVTSSKFGPAFFLWPNSQAVATYQNFALAAAGGTFPGATTVPAKPGDVIILWGTGFGPTTPAAPVGEETPSGTTYSTSTLPTVEIDNVSAKVYGAALAPGFAGLYQVAIQVPSSIGNGNWPVVATVGEVSSPSGAVLTVQQ
jgi:uncharacterized protein (TIGR03437 family)